MCMTKNDNPEKNESKQVIVNWRHQPYFQKVRIIGTQFIR